MKKQQWLFKVFSKTLTPLLNSSISYNIARPFCLAATPTPTPTPTNTSLFDVNSNNNKLHMLSEKKLPLLIVPSSTKERKLGYYSSVCNDTLGFISFFHADGDGDGDDHDQLNKKKKKEEEVYKVSLPEIADRRICGSSEGWLVTVHENSEIQLLNPISRVLVHLPPLTSFPEVVGKLVLEENRGLCYIVNEDISGVFEHLDSDCSDERLFAGYDSHLFREEFLKKVVTNTTDANSTLPTVVMAIYGDVQKLAFCKLSGNGIDNDGDETKRWICCLKGDRCDYDDVAFYKGNFYAVQNYGRVVVVEGLDGPSPFITTIIDTDINERKYFSDMKYLVESSGDLFMVMRHIEEKEDPYRTTGFRVLKLDFNGSSWVEVTNLGEDCALFVGYNHSFSFSASKFPGCRGNCIYFTDNNLNLFYKNTNWGHDMGIYNLEDGNIDKLYQSSSQQPPLVWYVPN